MMMLMEVESLQCGVMDEEERGDDERGRNKEKY